jgi:hypothetical protein
MSTRTLTLSAAALLAVGTLGTLGTLGTVVAATAAQGEPAAPPVPATAAPSPADAAALVDARHQHSAQHQLDHAAELSASTDEVAAARPAPALQGGSRFTLLSIPGEEYFLVDAGETGESVGDQSAFTDILRTRAGKDVGYSAATCTTTSVRAHQALCHATLVLDRGTLAVTGVLADGASFTAAVTGGTGTWAAAGGTMTGTALDDDSLRLDFELQGR